MTNSATWLACLALGTNYGSRVVVSIVAHVVCQKMTCDAAALIGAASSAFFIGDWLAQMTAKPLLRRLGGKNLMSLCTAGWGVSMLLMVFAMQAPLPVMLCVQVFFGLFCGYGYPSGHSLIAETVPVSQRTTALSFLYSAAGLGTTFAYAAIPLATESYGWQTSFIIFMACGIAIAAVVHLFCPGVTRVTPAAVTSPGSQVQAGELQEIWQWISDPLVAALILTQASNGVIWAGFYQSYFPTLFLEKFEVGFSDLGWVTSAAPLSYAAIAVSCGFFADHLIAKRLWPPYRCRMLMQTIGSLIPAASLVIISVTLDTTLAVVFATIWLGAHAVQSSGQSASLHDVGQSRAGELFVLVNIFGKLAGILSPPILQYVARSWGWNVVLQIVAGHYILAAVVLVPMLRCTEKSARLFKTAGKEQ